MTEFDMPCEITQSYWIRCKEHVQLCACKAQSPVSLSTSQLRRGKWWKSSFCVSLFKLQLIFMHVFSMVRPISLPLIFCVQAEDNNNEKSDGRFQLLGWKTCTVPTSSTNWNWKSKIRICMAAAGETSGLSPVSLTFAHLCEHGAFNFVFTVVVFFFQRALIIIYNCALWARESLAFSNIHRWESSLVAGVAEAMHTSHASALSGLCATISDRIIACNINDNYASTRANRKK